MLTSRYEDRFVIDDPKKLLTALRFDLAAKTLYARHREKNAEMFFAKSVYEHHLDVWGGFTERLPAKNGVNDFYESFHSVLDNMKTEGFDEEKSFIPVDENHLLLNGSHRVASAIHYQKPVVCNVSPQNAGLLVCTADYFLNKKDIVTSGLRRDVADAMALEYIRLKKNVFIASLYQHTFEYMSDIAKVFMECGASVVYSKDIVLTDTGKVNYIISAYSDESWMGNASNGFPGAYNQANLNFAQGGHVRVVMFECSGLEQATKIKNQIRQIVGVGKPSVHTTDTPQEAWRNATIAFHDPTLKFFNTARIGAFNTFKIRHFVNETMRVVHGSDLELEDFCVGGSAPLALYGKRDCRDFDVVHLPSHNIPFTEKVSSHNDYLKYYVDDPRKIIFNPSKHIYVHGLKFLSIEGMVKMKSTRGEEKDIRDIQMAQEFLTTRFKNIVVLAAGPPKPNRNRHLETFKGKPLINNLLDECGVENTKAYVVVSKKNNELAEHIKSEYPSVGLLFAEDDRIRSTFNAALSLEGDCIMIAGDLVNVSKNDLEKFVFSEYRSATCHYQQPWGAHISSKTGNMLRRADIGDCIMMIGEEHKEEFLSEANLARGKELFAHFYPSGNQYDGWNDYWYNDAGTFTSFAFFEKLWSTPNCNSDDTKGLVSYNHRIYEDND